MNHGLLETLAGKINAAYLSDLRMMSHRKELLRLLSQVPAQDYPVEEWQDAVAYLAGKPGSWVKDSEEAKKYLMEQLK